MNMKTKLIITSVMTIAVCLSLIAGSTFAYFTSNADTGVAITSARVNVTAKIKQDTLKIYSLGVEQTATNNEGDRLFENLGTATWSDDGELELNLIAPGDKAEFTIEVANTSNIAIKYKVTMDVKYAAGSANSQALAEGLVGTVTIDGENYPIANAADIVTDNGNGGNYIEVAPNTDIADILVSIELPTAVGNEAQEGVVSISFALVAIQGNGDVTTLETSTTEETTSNN